MEPSNINPKESTSNKPTADEHAPEDTNSMKPDPKESSQKEPAQNESVAEEPRPDETAPKAVPHSGDINQNSATSKPPTAFSQPGANVPQQPEQWRRMRVIDSVYRIPSSISPRVAPWVEVGESHLDTRPQASPDAHLISALYSVISVNEPPEPSGSNASIPQGSPTPDLEAKGQRERDAVDAPKKG
ncbi:hypothetical protein O1611_g4902 [Lasiodiplodia mahajangana]|uniref:Uncharacterized protein n=1 Tax=Lasiodiplodia mahajangana TaxID=1108764 RepID=A0ACC2JMJ7_9PEZI|nr:hypothetical protein O1611_g4902 [Lasiodiplodia mahajangana]